MKLKYLALPSLLLIIACNLSRPSPAATATAPTPPPEAAPTVASPTEPVATEPAADTVFFRDDFDDGLGAGWEWINEDPQGWSLSDEPGSLLIEAGPGSVYDDTITNLLLRPAPNGEFLFETRVSFQPSANYQFAGLIAYESPGNFIQAGRAFCDGLETCSGDGLYIDYYQNGDFILPNFSVPYDGGEALYLRLVWKLDTYVFHTSADGQNWDQHGGQTSSGAPLKIGLVTGQNQAAPIPALFDYFEVQSVD